MAGYSGGMSEAAATFRATDPVEARLRGALDQGDVVLSTVAPVLRHLLASDDSGLFGDAILARVRGMSSRAHEAARTSGAHNGPERQLPLQGGYRRSGVHTASQRCRASHVVWHPVAPCDRVSFGRPCGVPDGTPT